ncbi:MAG: hypothetical protein WAW39_11460 [Prosthecobacter sp.]|uniref:hypothetical protein n=1 Tax=Prosthecobacter sp. TaxID=1965333 RepID=UPI003BAFFEF6
MLVYIPAPAAQPLSDALWGLMRPTSVRGEKDTQYLFPWVTALDGSLWLMVDTEYAITVHAEAVLGGIADILQPFIDAGQVPAETNAQLSALIDSKRGDVLVVYEAFPPFFKAQAKTLQQMIEGGRLPVPEPTP